MAGRKGDAVSGGISVSISYAFGTVVLWYFVGSLAYRQHELNTAFARHQLSWLVPFSCYARIRPGPLFRCRDSPDLSSPDPHNSRDHSNPDLHSRPDHSSSDLQDFPDRSTPGLQACSGHSTLHFRQKGGYHSRPSRRKRLLLTRS